MSEGYLIGAGAQWALERVLDGTLASLMPGDLDRVREALRDAVRGVLTQSSATLNLAEPAKDLLLRDENLLGLAEIAVAGPVDASSVSDLRNLLADIDWDTSGGDPNELLPDLLHETREAVRQLGSVDGRLAAAAVAVRLDDLRESAGSTELLGSTVGTLRLPPPVAESLRELDAIGDPAADHLVQWLRRPDTDLRVVAAWTREPPDWLEHGSSRAWRFLADLTQAHGHARVAVDCLRQAADRSRPMSARLHARAALLLAQDGDNPDEADVDSIDATATPDEYVRVVLAAARLDWPAVLTARPDLEEDDASRLLLDLLLVMAQARTGSSREARANALRICAEWPTSTGAKILAAQLLLSAGRTAVGTQDLHRSRRDALRLALDARDARRAWDGPSEDAVEVAAQAAFVLEDFDLVLELCLPPPRGVARSREAAAPGVRAICASAAAVAGRVDVARELVEGLQSADAILARSLIAEIDGHRDEAERLARDVLRDAPGNAHACDQALRVLAGLGRLTQADVDEIDSEEATILQALNLAQQGDEGAAILLMRERGEVDTAEYVRLSCTFLVSLGEVELAATRLAAAAIRFGIPALKVEAAMHRCRLGQWDEARSLTLEALASLDPGEPQWKTAQRVLADLAVRSNDWPSVLAISRTLVAADDQDSHARWLSCLALVHLDDNGSAWEVISSRGLLAPEESWQAHLFIELVVGYMLDGTTIAHLLGLSERFADDERLRAHVIFAIASLPEDLVDTDSALVGMAQRSASSFFESFPDSEYLRAIDASDIDALVGELRDVLRPTAERSSRAQDAVRKGGPGGLLSAAAGRTYAAVWLTRAAGHLPMTAADAHEADRVDARERTRTIVVDASALATLAAVPELWPHLRAVSTQLMTTERAARDVIAARDEYQQNTSVSMAWDLTDDLLTVSEIDENTIGLLRSRSAAMAGGLQNLESVRWGSPLQVLVDLDVSEFEAWAGPVDMALANGYSIYCDDVGLRRLARLHGAGTFDTTALVDVLVESGRLTSDDRDRIRHELAAEFAVDLLDARYLVAGLVSRHGVGSIAAAYPLSRPDFWMPDARDALRVVRLTLQRVGMTDDGQLARWVAFAAVGATRALGPDAGTALIAEAIATCPNPTVRAQIFLGARQVGAEIGVRDFAAGVVEQLTEVLEGQVSQDIAIATVLNLLSELPVDVRQDVVGDVLVRRRSSWMAPAILVSRR